MNIELTKAIFQTAFQLGHRYGCDAANAHSWGGRSVLPQTWDEAWTQEVQNLLDHENPEIRLDPNNPQDWLHKV